MSTPYDPPQDPEERMIEIALDSWVNYSRWILWFCGIIYLLFGFVIGPLYGLSILSNPEVPTEWGIAMFAGISIVSLATGGVFGLLNLITASGLGRGAKWSWYVALVIGALYAPSACCLFGFVLMYVMLNEKTRRLFLG